MAEKVLDRYVKRKAELEQRFQTSGSSVAGLLVYQELIYRISVLQTLQMFTAVAPVATDMKKLIAHYQMLDGYIHGLLFERQFGVPDDDDLIKHREAARLNLCRVVEDYHKRFSSFAAEAPDQYKKEIDRTILTVLSAWNQYRDVYVSLKQNEEAL